MSKHLPKFIRLSGKFIDKEFERTVNVNMIKSYSRCERLKCLYINIEDRCYRFLDVNGLVISALDCFIEDLFRDDLVFKSCFICSELEADGICIEEEHLKHRGLDNDDREKQDKSF